MSSRSNKYFYCHIPKTGGTTFRIILEDIFGEKIIPSNNEIETNDQKYPELSEIIDKHKNLEVSKYQILRGHYHLSAQTLFGENCKSMAIFRDPFQRTVSHLKHLIEHTNDFNENKIKEMLDAGNYFLPDNLMTRYIVGEFISNEQDSHRDHNNYIHSRELGPIDDYAAEIEQKLKSLYFISTTTNLDNDLETFLQKEFNYKYVPAKLNTTNDVNLKLSKENKSLIEEHNQLDRYLFELATKYVN